MSVSSSIAAAAQAMIKSFGVKIRVDGIWGKNSKRAHEGLKSSQRKIIDSYFVAAGASQNAKSSSVRSDVMAAIESAAKEFNIEVDLMRRFASIESNFDPKALSQSGSFAGLYQMGSAAWSDVNDVLKQLGKPGVGSYQANKFDLTHGSRAGTAYVYLNKRYLERKGYPHPFGWFEAYMCHQQGAGGFMVLWRAANGSGKVDGRAIKAMASNPPQDRRGVTTDPAEFLSRWKERVIA